MRVPPRADGSEPAGGPSRPARAEPAPPIRQTTTEGPLRSPDDDLRGFYGSGAQRRRSQGRWVDAARRLALRVGVVAWIGFLVFGLVVTPRAIGDLRQQSELPEARITRDRIGQRLEALRDRFLLLASDVDALRRRVEKIRIAYGLALSAQPPVESPVDPNAFPKVTFLPQIEETARLATRVRIEVVELEAKVQALRSFESARPDLVAFTPALSPLRGEFVMTSGFGYRKSAFTDAQEYHSGVDLGAAVGTEVVAPADGRVVFVGRFPVSRSSTWWRLGNVVALRHGKDLVTLYGHLGKIAVRTGREVKRGDRLAEIGESGVIETPHLHYAVWRRATPGGELRPVDPRLLMLDRQWDDEEDLLASAAEGARSEDYEKLPRQLR